MRHTPVQDSCLPICHGRRQLGFAVTTNTLTTDLNGISRDDVIWLCDKVLSGSTALVWSGVGECVCAQSAGRLAAPSGYYLAKIAMGSVYPAAICAELGQPSKSARYRCSVWAATACPRNARVLVATVLVSSGCWWRRAEKVDVETE
jgi:hypothetical protein